MIVIYTDDERKGVDAAMRMCEKGFDNVYLLSGGYDEFSESFPEHVKGKVVPRYDKAERVNKAKALIEMMNKSPKKTTKARFSKR